MDFREIREVVGSILVAVVAVGRAFIEALMGKRRWY